MPPEGAGLYVRPGNRVETRIRQVTRPVGGPKTGQIRFVDAVGRVSDARPAFSRIPDCEGLKRRAFCGILVRDPVISTPNIDGHVVKVCSWIPTSRSV